MNDTFFTHFLITSLASSVMMLFVLMVKKGLSKHIAIRWQYNLGLLFFVVLATPFIPASLLSFINISDWLFSSLHLEQPAAASAKAIAEGGTQALNDMNWLQDFTISVGRASPGYIAPLLMLIWLTGITVVIIVTFVCNRHLRLVMESVKSVEDGELATLFRQCKAELDLNKDILLGTSILVKSPVTIGIFKTRIILPAEIMKTSSARDVRYVLLHELMHCKNKDLPVNYGMCIFQIVYWFNPLVYLAFKEMRLDREMACDSSVLKRLPKEHHIEYGKTLLKFIHELSHPAALSFATDMGGSRQQMKKRVEGIASFQADSRLLKVKSVCVFALTGFLILSQIPAISALAFYDDGKYRFGADNVVYEDLSSFFDGFEGCFVLYDPEADLYTIHNKEKSVTRVSPASTYKIYSALIALETGVISADRSVQEWNGTAYPYDTWNKDQDLMTAMQDSVSWYFQTIDAQVGMKELDSWFTQLSYGNHNLSGGIGDYWMDSTLLISPVEQVELLTDFYQNDTLFKTEHVNTLKDIIRLSEKDGAVLSGKTGTGSVNGNVINGWFIGYVENNGHTSIFAANIQGEDNAGGSAAVQITLAILKDKHIY